MNQVDRIQQPQRFGWFLVGLLLAGALGFFVVPRFLTVPEFEDPVRPALVETTTPSHGQLLPGPPLVIVIDTNQDVVTGSTIDIRRDSDLEVVLTAADTAIDPLLTSFHRPLDTTAMTDGRYTVTYRVCTQPTSCVDGRFQFAINQRRAANFTDLRQQSAVTIDLKQIRFEPQLVRVSRGTTVTWINQDSVGHYINTDSHPAHTYYPAQNSELLAQGDAFHLQFREPGYYPYHCSAHTEMTAVILVD